MTCLVELIEMPFTVVACADILLVNLERVGFNLRNFDMTIIYKACHGSPWNLSEGRGTKNVQPICANLACDCQPGGLR